jgi:hypothetical protein
MAAISIVMEEARLLRQGLENLKGYLDYNRAHGC